MSEVIDFRDRSKRSEPTAELPEPHSKQLMIDTLEELLADVKANKVNAVFCVWTFNQEPGLSMGFRAGNQGCNLLGRIDYFRHRMIAEMDD